MSMYWLKVDRKILQDGRTAKYIANVSGTNQNLISSVLNKKSGCSKRLALLLTFICTGSSNEFENLFEERKK